MGCLAKEPEMNRRYSDYYTYEFFVARRPVPSAVDSMRSPNGKWPRPLSFNAGDRGACPQGRTLLS
jgi:hypothetical protein